MAQQELHLNTKNDLSYYLLNVIHDIIHDYSNADSDRWEYNCELIKRFHSNYTFGNVPIIGGKVDVIINKTPEVKEYISPMQKNGIKSDTNIIVGPDVKFDSFIKESETKYDNYINDTVEYENTLNQFIEGIKCEIIARSYLLHKLFSSKFASINDIDVKNIVFCYIFSSYNNKKLSPIDNIYNDISHDFYYFFLKNKNKNIDLSNFDNFKKVLDEFLDNTYYVKINVFINVYANENDFVPMEIQSVFEQTRGIKRGRSDDDSDENSRKRGGAKDAELSPTESEKLIREVNAYIGSPEYTTKMQIMENVYNNNQRTSGDVKNYMDTRKQLINDIRMIYENQEFPQKKSASILNDIQTVAIRTSGRVAKEPLSVQITNFIRNSLEKYQKIIDEETERVRLIALRQEKDDLLAGMGKLTSDDKNIVSEFMKFISKTGLLINNVIDINNQKITDTTSSELLIKQKNILLKFAEIIPFGNARDKTFVNTRALDNELLSYWKDVMIPQYQPQIKLDKGYNLNTDNKYIINNAAPLGSKIDSKSFCPYTSILDGMTYCGWGENSSDRLEYGNINFKVCCENETPYYNGYLTIGSNNNVNLGIDIQFPQLRISINKDISMSGSSLQATNVLKETLTKLINGVNDSTIIDSGTAGDLFSGNRFFDNLYKYRKNNENPFFKIILENILFKGCGDIFQEINAVAKNGGYVSSITYSNTSNIVKFDDNGYAGRFFAANDRPSGTRFIHLLLNSDPKDINIKAFGGYVSKAEDVVVKHPSNPSIVSGGKNTSLKKHSMKNKNFMTKKYKSIRKKQKSIQKKSTMSPRKTRKHKN